MAESSKEPIELDRLIHEPARLAILTALASSEGADFVFLKRLTGLTDGNLSSHLSKLESAELVNVEKRFVGKKPNTFASATGKGREATERHWEQLERLREGAGGEFRNQHSGTAK